MAEQITKTLLHTLEQQAEKHGDGSIALRYLRGGKWIDVSWKAYLANVRATAHGLAALGLAPGEKLSLLSANCPQWFYTDLGTMALGAATVAIYPNYTPDQIRYIVEHSESKILVVQNADLLAKSRPLLDEIDSLEHIVVFDEAAAGDGVLSFEKMLADGVAREKEKPDDWAAWLEALKLDSMATIQYTSGTTGPPKGAMLSHLNIATEAEALKLHFNLEGEETISFLPLSHIAERVQGVFCSVSVGGKVTFARSLETLREDLTQVRPTLLMCVPRLYEKFYSGIIEQVKTAGGIKEKLFNWTLNVGDRARALRNDSNKPLPFGLKIKWALAQKIVVDKLKARLGMDRCHLFASGAAPLSAEIARFFGSLGMDILEVYGLTECVGVCTGNPVNGVRPGSVGTQIPFNEVKIAGDGEILVRGNNVFMGYYRQEEATAETLVDGWLLTGDVGEFDGEGYLKITDRKKDIIVTAGGKNVAPQNIENMLKTYAGISQVVVVGDKRKYLTALVTLDNEALPALLADLDLDSASVKNAHENEKVIARLQDYFDEVNGRLARFETVKYFRVLPHDFTIESGEMTPSLKVKRRVVQEKYEDLIDGMYGG